MIKFNGLNLKDLKITDALASVVNGKKIAVGSEVIWEKSVSPLPSGYTEVKYLQSSRTQYIDTLVKGKNTIGMYLDFQCPTYQNAYAVGVLDLNVIRFCPLLLHDHRIKYEKQLSPQVLLIYENYNAQRHTLYFNYNSDGKVVYDGVEKEAFGNLGTTSTKNIYLFKRNYLHSDSGAIIKFYSVIMTDGVEMIRNYIPCLDTNNTPCFYDTVTQQTFYNQGTGTFGYETMDGTVVAPT